MVLTVTVLGPVGPFLIGCYIDARKKGPNSSRQRPNAPSDWLGPKTPKSLGLFLGPNEIVGPPRKFFSDWVPGPSLFLIGPNEITVKIPQGMASCRTSRLLKIHWI